MFHEYFMSWSERGEDLRDCGRGGRALMKNQMTAAIFCDSGMLQSGFWVRLHGPELCGLLLTSQHIYIDNATGQLKYWRSKAVSKSHRKSCTAEIKKQVYWELDKRLRIDAGISLWPSATGNAPVHHQSPTDEVGSWHKLS